MYAIIEGNKRITLYDLASEDFVDTYMWSKEVTNWTARTILITKNGPSGETRILLGCWATYANKNYIPNIDDEDL